MVKKSKLLAALDRERGRDYQLEKQKKLQKEAEKRKRTKQQAGEDAVSISNAANTGQVNGNANGDISGGSEDDAWDTEQSADEGTSRIDISQLDGIDDSDSPSEEDEPEQVDMNDGLISDAADSAEEDEEDIPLSDLESVASDEKGDIIPHQRMTINNTAALLKAYKSFALPYPSLQFSDHMSITSAAPTQDKIQDVDDDLNRELQLYAQSLEAVKDARKLCQKDGIPWSRPADYFAEMVKSDEHMGRVKQKLVDEAASKKAAAEARRQRDLKKFGKQVQVAKMQERDKAKRDTLDKINLLKRKRSNADGPTRDREDDMFDVALEDEVKDAKPRRDKNASGKSNPKRQKKDEKYGFGGKKRFAKSGDALSSADMRGFSTKKMKAGAKKPQRPGKSRRAKRV